MTDEGAGMEAVLVFVSRESRSRPAVPTPWSLIQTPASQSLDLGHDPHLRLRGVDGNVRGSDDRELRLGLASLFRSRVR